MKRYAALLVAILAVSSPGSVCAGLYSPNEPPAFEFNKDGTAEALPFASFRVLMGDIAALDFRPPRPEHIALTERVEKRMKEDPATLSPEEIAGLTHDLIRLRRLDEALNILQRLTRNPRQAGFLSMSHLARVHQGRGEWPEAYEHEYSALRDYPFPKTFPGYINEQLAWLHRVENDYYLPFLRSRREESRQKRLGGVQENVDALFLTPKKEGAPASRQPVAFVGESGTFEPGTIAAAERAKLPSDAIAIVQQLILWSPDDSRLFWQLGELYNAQGDLDTAAQIFDLCVDIPRNYSNKQLMEHRNLVRAALPAWQDARRKKAAEEQAAAAARTAADRAEAEEKSAAEKARQEEEHAKKNQRIIVVGSITSVFIVLLGYWQVRELRRRLNGRDRSRRN